MESDAAVLATDRIPQLPSRSCAMGVHNVGTVLVERAPSALLGRGLAVQNPSRAASASSTVRVSSRWLLAQVSMATERAAAHAAANT